MRAWLPVVLGLSIAGCAGAQRAAVGPAVVDVDAAIPGSPSTPRPPASRAIVRAPASSITLRTGTLTATFVSRIPQLRGVLEVDTGISRSGHLRVEVELGSLECDTEMVADVLKNDILEIDAYPVAILDAAIRPRGESDGIALEGTLMMHGIRRPIAFDARWTQTGDRHRLTSTFVIDRRHWRLHQHTEWDWINRNDVTITTDIVAWPDVETPQNTPDEEPR